jgi:sulfur relay (sulfurtransferase) DsrF/TusC family protein
MAFFCQLQDPRYSDNILYRVFIAVDNDYECENYYISKIELNKENLKKQTIIHKTENNSNQKITKFGIANFKNIGVLLFLSDFLCTLLPLSLLSLLCVLVLSLCCSLCV